MISDKDSKRLDIIRVFGSYGLKRIVEDRPPCIGELARVHGQEKAELAVAIVIHDLGLSFDGDISKEQASEIAAEVSSGLMRNITLEGVFATCQEIKRSDVYGKLTPNKILKALNKHLEEYCESIANANYNRHLSMRFEGERSADREMKKLNEIKHDFQLQNLKKEHGAH